MKDAAIRVEDISLRYGDRLALDRISLQVRPGEHFALLGPNGAGKSSLVSVLATLHAPDAGRAEVAGHDIARAARAVRQAIGMVFQDASLDSRLSAEENLDFHGRVYGMSPRDRRAAIDRELALVALDDRRDTLVRDLSGGMKRRLEIARALMHQPQILFLDEPTVGLDPQTRARIWQDLARQRAARGLTTLTTTHHIDEVEGADRICIIDDGRLIAEGTPEALKRAHGQSLLHLRPADAGARAAILARYPQASGTDELTLAVPDDGFVPGFLAEFGARIAQMRYQAPTLETVFLNLTGRDLRETPEPAKAQPARAPR